jgi:hypothetical protein
VQTASLDYANIHEVRIIIQNLTSELYSPVNVLGGENGYIASKKTNIPGIMFVLYA